MPTCLLERPAAPFPMITDEVSRRSFLAGLGVVGMLTACGSDTNVPASLAGSRVLVDDRGEIRLDAVPQRIVTIYEESTELIVALGLKPVGTGSNRLATTDPARVFDGYYLTPEQIGTPTFVGSGPFNLEAIAALEPDLILPGSPTTPSSPHWRRSRRPRCTTRPSQAAGSRHCAGSERGSGANRRRRQRSTGMPPSSCGPVSSWPRSSPRRRR